MSDHKIVFTGTTGAGKTTAIAAISDTPPVMTDVPSTDPSTGKPMTTVGLDFGQVRLDSGEQVRLFGTPGQVRFDFLWRILARNAIGVVVLIDNSRPDPLADMATYLDAFRAELDVMACVVGVGRTEQHASPTIDDFVDALAARGLVLPVLPVDVRQRDDVLMLLDTLLAQIEASNAE
ncbi:ATP/GTP-binding protein [Ramlibacter sp.]|uniref:GTP-binding protein n=1 Tax=Ramlibacter sp. TaxID=1917967 RepID=UPI0035B322B7